MTCTYTKCCPFPAGSSGICSVHERAIKLAKMQPRETESWDYHMASVSGMYFKLDRGPKRGTTTVGVKAQHA